MDTIKVNKKNCKMIAHRGLSGIERENTCAAFVAAGNRSYYGIETDVHVTKDGKYVIYHDNTTGRLAEKDVLVEGTDLETLQSLTLLDMEGGRGRRDLYMPTLQEYISICKKYDKVAVLELKNTFKPEQLYEICEIIKDFEYLDKVIFISFCLDNLIVIREKYPDQAVQFLCCDFSYFLVDLLKHHKMDLDISYTELNEEYVKILKDAGIKINCWTVDDKEACEKLIEMGVDFITTDILE